MTISVKLQAIGGNTPKRWEALSKTIQADSLKDLSEEAIEVVAILKHYPPNPPGSTYVRTFKLQNAWRITASMIGGAAAVNIRNNVTAGAQQFVKYNKSGAPHVYTRKKASLTHYAGYVQGPLAEDVAGKGQTYLHRSHGWLSIDDVLIARNTTQRLIVKMRNRIRILS